ncbi:hypothetical protein AHAS_Ahas09G0173700 [Arachis hypogaea]
MESHQSVITSESNGGGVAARITMIKSISGPRNARIKIRKDSNEKLIPSIYSFCLSVVDEQLVPKVGMTFKNLEDAAKFYKDYAKGACLLYPVKLLSCCISGASKFQPISRTYYELSVQETSSSG